MILDSLRLKNVGLYQGEVEVQFASGAQRITLIGGKNGAGKTTLLNAIPLALYGGRARSVLGVSSYGEYLNRLVHTGATRASVAVEFHQTEGGKRMRYEVERSWSRSRNGKSVDRLEVTVNGRPRPDLENAWPEFMEGVLPLSVSGLAFFDGEKIESLADVSSSTEVLRTSLYGLLGLELVDRLRRDLSEYRRKVAHEAPAVQSDLLKRLVEAEQSLAIVHREVDTTREELERIRHEADLARADLAAAQERLSNAGGDLFVKREQLRADLQATRSDVAAHHRRLEALVSGDLPLLMLGSLLERVSVVGEQVKVAEEAELLLQKMKERDERLLDTVENDPSFSEGHLTSLLQILEADRAAYAVGDPPRFHVSSEAAVAATDLLGPVGQALRDEVSQVVRAVISDGERLAALETSVQSLPDEEIMAGLLREVDQAEERLAATELRTRVTSEHVAEAERRALAAQREVDRLATEVIETGASQHDVARISREIEKADATLVRFSSRIVERNVKRISKNISNSLSELLRKESLISRIAINPHTLVLTLFGRDGAELNPAKLSAGERQMLATALLWGLSRSTGLKLPTVIDTPVGRLDRSHRINLVDRYFPGASQQVVLLSTDEEIVGSYLERLEPHIGARYLLDYDEEDDRTRIVEGYFK